MIGIHYKKLENLLKNAKKKELDNIKIIIRIINYYIFNNVIII